MKKKLLPILSLLLLFCLCACSTKPEKNFEYDEGMMINMTKAVVNKCYNVSGAQAEYILKEGEMLRRRQLPDSNRLRRRIRSASSRDMIPRKMSRPLKTERRAMCSAPS